MIKKSYEVVGLPSQFLGLPTGVTAWQRAAPPSPGRGPPGRPSGASEAGLGTTKEVLGLIIALAVN